MAYKCPRCGEDVRRGQSTAAGVVGGLVGILVASAFAPFLCDRCGTIPRSEFSASDRAEMIIGSLAMVAVALLLFVGVIYLLVSLIG